MNALNTSTNASIDSTTTAEPPATPPTSPTPAAGPAAGKARVGISFITRDSNASLLVATERVLVAMTGNTAFPGPKPTLAAVIAARTAFAAAVNAAHDSRVAKAGRQQQRQSFETLLRQLAEYVQTTSAGDLPTLLSSGFPAQRAKQPVGVLTAPGNLRLARGKLGGEIDARCQRSVKAGAYQWRYAAGNAPNTWIAADPTLAAKTTLENLTPGVQYTVQVRAIGSIGPSEWSDVAMLMAA